MKSPTSPSLARHRYGLDLPIILAWGSALALGLVFASSMEPRWFLVIVSSLIFCSVFLAVPDKEKVLLYIAVFLLPIGLDFHPFYIENLPYFLPAVGLRVSAFDVVFFCLLMAWFFKLLHSRQYSIRFYPHISIPVAIIWAISVIDYHDSALPGLIKTSYLYYVVRNWLIFLYIVNNIRHRNTLLAILMIYFLGGVLQALIGFSQYATGSTLGLDLFGEKTRSFFAMKVGGGYINRVAGILGHPNKLATYLGLLLPCNLSLIFAPISNRYKVLLTFTFLLIAAADLLTFSRAGWLNAGLGCAIVILWILIRRMRQVALPLVVTILLALTVAGLSLTFSESIRNRVFGHDYGAAYARIPLAQLALNMTRAKPLLGVGLGDFTSVSQQYDNTRVAISQVFPMPVHNEFLLVAAELGILGLCAYLYVVLVVLASTARQTRSGTDPMLTHMGIGFLASWIGLLANYQLTFGYTILIAYPFWFHVGLLIKSADIALNGRTLNYNHGLS